jgi:hypothetical protein
MISGIMQTFAGNGSRSEGLFGGPGWIALGSPVSLDYCEKAPFKFNGTIEKMHVKYVASP